MKKTTTKKLASGLIVALILATIGAVLVTADTGDDAEDIEEWHMPFKGRGIFGIKELRSDLTDEQQIEIDELITSLDEEGATSEEIREAVNQLFDEWGILDERLDSVIEYTEEKLAILERTNELRDQGYSWDEINDIIQEEFDLEYPTGIGQGMMFGRGFGRGFCCRHIGFSEEESVNEITTI